MPSTLDTNVTQTVTMEVKNMDSSFMSFDKATSEL